MNNDLIKAFMKMTDSQWEEVEDIKLSDEVIEMVRLYLWAHAGRMNKTLKMHVEHKLIEMLHIDAGELKRKYKEEA